MNTKSNFWIVTLEWHEEYQDDPTLLDSDVTWAQCKIALLSRAIIWWESEQNYVSIWEDNTKVFPNIPFFVDEKKDARHIPGLEASHTTCFEYAKKLSEIYNGECTIPDTRLLKSFYQIGAMLRSLQEIVAYVLQSPITEQTKDNYISQFHRYLYNIGDLVQFYTVLCDSSCETDKIKASEGIIESYINYARSYHDFSDEDKKSFSSFNEEFESLYHQFAPYHDDLTQKHWLIQSDKSSQHTVRVWKISPESLRAHSNSISWFFLDPETRYVTIGGKKIYLTILEWDARGEIDENFLKKPGWDNCFYTNVHIAEEKYYTRYHVDNIVNNIDINWKNSSWQKYLRLLTMIDNTEISERIAPCLLASFFDIAKLIRIAVSFPQENNNIFFHNIYILLDIYENIFSLVLDPEEYQWENMGVQIDWLTQIKESFIKFSQHDDILNQGQNWDTFKMFSDTYENCIKNMNMFFLFQGQSKK